MYGLCYVLKCAGAVSMMNAWLLWLAISIILGRIHHATSQDGESVQLAVYAYFAAKMDVDVANG